MTPRVRLAVFLSGLVLVSQAFPLPSPVWDIAAGAWAEGFRMDYGVGYILLAPFCGLADALTLLGLRSSFVFLALITLGIGLCFWLGGAKTGVVSSAILVVFLAWGVLGPRPMARLVASNPDILIIDFHSHTSASHDGRPSFGTLANMRWHKEQGYGAAFITDHNRIQNALEGRDLTRQNGPELGYFSLVGEEVSLEKTHLVVLGTRDWIDNRPYDSDPSKIPIFIKDMHKKGLLVMASLPEYWQHHWGKGVQNLMDWGIDGFEVVNSAPEALDFPSHMRHEILNLCSLNNLLITGISDSHGYGFATAAWNALMLPGWRNMTRDSLENAVIQKLKRDRFQAVRVLERARWVPSAPWEHLMAPLVAFVFAWRSLTPLLAWSWIAWIWIGLLLYSRAYKASPRSRPKV